MKVGRFIAKEQSRATPVRSTTPEGRNIEVIQIMLAQLNKRHLFFFGAVASTRRLQQDSLSHPSYLTSSSLDPKETQSKLSSERLRP